MKYLETIKHITLQDLRKLYNRAPNGTLAKRYLAIIQLYLGKAVPETAWHIQASQAI